MVQTASTSEAHVPGTTVIRVLGALLILWGGYRLYVVISSVWLDEEGVVFVPGFAGLFMGGVFGLLTIVAGLLLVRLHRAGRVFGLWVCSVNLAFEVLAFGLIVFYVPARSLGLLFWLLQPLEIILFLVGIILIARWHPPRKIKREQLGRIFD